MTSVSGCAATSVTSVWLSAAVVGRSRASEAANTDRGAASGARIQAVRSEAATVVKPATVPAAIAKPVGRTAGRAGRAPKVELSAGVFMRDRSSRPWP